jgi:hypothetical protein
MAADPSFGDGSSTERPWVYPTDPRDGWEPGAPSVRAMAPSAVGGAVVPIVVYFVARHHVHGDAPALAIAGVPAALWVLLEGVRRRTLDPIGSIVLLGFVAGITASWALGGNAFVLKVRDAAIGAVIGAGALASLAMGAKPLMFHVGRALSAGGDATRLDLYDQLWTIPPSRAVFRLLTFAWGVGLLADATCKIVAALVLPTSTFVVVGPVLSACFLGSLLILSIWMTQWSRGRVERMSGPFPDDGGTTLWWLRQMARA